MLKEGNVTVMVWDMSKSIRFYTETLGLKLKFRMADEWAEVEAPGLTIGLHPVRPGTAAKSNRQGSFSIGFTVDNLEQAMGHLKERGISFSSPIIDNPPIRLANFQDPDETPLYLCQVMKS